MPQDALGGASPPPWTALRAPRDDGGVTKNRSSAPAAAP
jgi:hypothetical protein